MSMQDPVADMLTIIRNAQMIGIKSVRLPFSQLKNDVLNVLKEEGYITSCAVVADGNKRDLTVELKYYEGRPVIEKIQRKSKPSLRVYKGYKDIPLVRGGLGVTILSTPKGVMTDKNARANQVGGEVLCIVE